ICQFGRGHPKTVGSKILYYEIRRQAADPTIGPDLRELIEQLASTFGPDYRLTQLVRNNLGLYLTTSQDDWDEAESLFRSVIAARIRSYGEGIYDEIRASAEGNLGSLLARRAALRKKRALLAGESMSDEEKSRVQSDLNEAVPLLRAQIEALEGIGTLTGADIINAKNSLVVGLGLRKAEGDLEEAVALSEDVVRRYTEDVGPDDFFTSHARYNRARLLTSQERFEEALAELNALYSAARQSPDMRLRFWAPAFRSARAECFFHLENFVVAERELKAALPGLRAIGPDFVQNAEMLLAKIAEKWNDDATSEETPVSEKESTEGKEGGK
ncbi:MAG: tetratricopeptide repeat protein, partial [Planctomycetota bacterium]